MLQLQRILVPTDLSPSAHAAFHLAYDLAERHQAEVHVLHVVPLAGTEPLHAFIQKLVKGPDASESIREAIAEQIENDLLRRGGQSYQVKQVHRQGADVAGEILDYAIEADVDLIAMGTRGHRSLAHPGLGGTAGEVVRRASCPVLTVREGAADEVDAALRVQHMLVPVDFSAHAEQAVQVAKELGALYGARLSLLFVAEERQVPFFSDTGLPSVYALKMEPEMVDQADEALRQVHASVPGPEVEASYHVRSGHPAREVLTFAKEEDVGLIVMSTRGQTEHAYFDLGGVAERVVRAAPCPVLNLIASGKSIVR